MTYSSSVSIQMNVGEMHGIDVAAVGGDSIVLCELISLPVGEIATVIVTVDGSRSFFTGRILEQIGKTVWFMQMLQYT